MFLFGAEQSNLWPGWLKTRYSSAASGIDTHKWWRNLSVTLLMTGSQCRVSMCNNTLYIKLYARTHNKHKHKHGTLSWIHVYTEMFSISIAVWECICVKENTELGASQQLSWSKLKHCNFSFSNLSILNISHIGPILVTVWTINSVAQTHYPSLLNLHTTHIPQLMFKTLSNLMPSTEVQWLSSPLPKFNLIVVRN